MASKLDGGRRLKRYVISNCCCSHFLSISSCCLVEMSGCELGRLLLKLFATGELAGTTVFDLAGAAWKDGWGRDCPLARKLVSVGASGRQRQRIVDGIIAAAESVGLVSSAAKPYSMDIATGGKVMVFLPHEFYSGMVNKTGLATLCLGQEALAAETGLPKLLKEWAVHDDVRYTGDLSTVGVLGMHADGVQYTSTVRAGGARSVVVGSMNIISASDGINHRRQPLFVLRKARFCGCGCQGFHTIQEIMAVVAWSMQCLRDGIAPSCRHDGSPWTSEDRESRMPAGAHIPTACLLQVRGDWEWLEQCFRLRHNTSDEFCWMCNATSKTPGPLHFHHFQEDAAHRATLISHTDYIRACAVERSQPSHLFRSPGLLLDHLTVDAMHAADLGTFQDAMGSLFWIEIRHRPWHRKQSVGLAALNISLNNFYAAHADHNFSRITPLVLSQILAPKPGYPYLKAKAAQTRHLAAFCLTLARQHRDGNGARVPFAFPAGHRLAGRTQQHCNAMVSLFEGLLGFTESCSAVPFSPEQCRAGMYKYLQSLEVLSSLWRHGLTLLQQAKMPFHIRPKCHMCQHLVHEKTLAFGSPSCFWCYRDESFVGAIKVIGGKTKHPKRLEERMIQKLRILAAFD